MSKVIETLLKSVVSNGRIKMDVSGSAVFDSTPATLTTASAQTLTTAHLTGGLLLRDPNGASRTDTTPTAAQIVAAVASPSVGDTFLWIVRNTADAAETITIGAGTGVTISGTATIAQNNTKIFLVRLDNVTAASEAVTVYSIMTGVF